MLLGFDEILVAAGRVPPEVVNPAVLDGRRFRAKLERFAVRAGGR